MKKKLILTMGPKGGIGKSTIVRAMWDYLRTLKKPDGSPVRVASYDTDPNVGQFAATCGLKNKDGKYDPKVNRLNPTDGVATFDARQDGDSFSDALDSDADVILMDPPGGLMDFSHVFGTTSAFKSQFSKEGYEIIIMIPISQVEASALGIKMIMDIWGAGVKFVVVKNHNFGTDEDFYCFDGELAATLGYPEKQVIAAGGMVIDFPALDHGAYGLIDRWKIPFADAVPKLLDMRGELKGWRVKLAKLETFIQEAAAEFDKVNILS